MSTVRLTTAQALVRWLIAQRTELLDGTVAPLFPLAFAIFGHGNVLGLGTALDEHRAELPVWRGHNEQGMALAAIAYARATERRQVGVVTTSIGPGALNMVTAAGVAHANRLPVLLLPGDTFTGRAPDPVLQQVEHFGDPGGTVNDAFRAVSRYFDRITRPEQLVATLPQVARVLTDPAECGPVVLALPQDTQAEAWDFPSALFAPVVRRVPRPRPDVRELAAAAEAVRAARRPLLVVGGGVRYSGATAMAMAFARRHGIPITETTAGRTLVPHGDPLHAGPLGITGSASANALAGAADLVIAVGTRLQDFTTASWTVFAPDVRLVTVNAARFDAVKHGALAVVGDAEAGLADLTTALANWRADPTWTARAAAERAAWDTYIDGLRAGAPASYPDTGRSPAGAAASYTDTNEQAAGAPVADPDTNASPAGAAASYPDTNEQAGGSATSYTDTNERAAGSITSYTDTKRVLAGKTPGQRPLPGEPPADPAGSYPYTNAPPTTAPGPDPDTERSPGGTSASYPDTERPAGGAAGPGLLSYAQVVGVVNDLSGPDDYVLTAAGGLPGELVGGWRAHGTAGPTMDVEYGFSCMGYELAGAWGATLARRVSHPNGVVTTLLGDGSYLMANSELFSAAFAGHGFVAIVCDNDGYAVIARLQRAQGGSDFNNQYPGCRTERADPPRADFAAHAAALGATVFVVSDTTRTDSLADAYRRARAAATDRPAVVVVRTDPSRWTESGAWWEVGTPQVAHRAEIIAARAAADRARAGQVRYVRQ